MAKKAKAVRAKRGEGDSIGPIACPVIVEGPYQTTGTDEAWAYIKSGHIEVHAEVENDESMERWHLTIKVPIKPARKERCRG